jgi:hypothetical protein
MSDDFKTILIRDSRLEDVSEKAMFAVFSGASSNTYQQFNSTSSSNNSLLSFNVRPPSESILFDRCIYISAVVNFQMVITGVPAGQRVFAYGLTDALQAFPLNRLFTTVQVQMNTASMSINSQDVLPALLRMLPTEVLQKYQNATPTLLDCYLNYSDGIGSNNNVLGGYGIADHNQIILGNLLIPKQNNAFSWVYKTITRHSVF